MLHETTGKQLYCLGIEAGMYRGLNMLEYDFGWSKEIDAYLEEGHAWWTNHLWLDETVKFQIDNHCIDVDSLRGLANPILV